MYGCVCIYVFIHSRIHSFKDLYSTSSRKLLICVNMYVCMCVCAYVYVCVWMCACVYACMSMPVYMYMNACMQACDIYRGSQVTDSNIESDSYSHEHDRICRFLYVWKCMRRLVHGCIRMYVHCNMYVYVCMHVCVCIFIHSFIHSGHFYSASSSPLLLRSAPDTARIMCRIFTPKRHRKM